MEMMTAAFAKSNENFLESSTKAVEQQAKERALDREFEREMSKVRALDRSGGDGIEKLATLIKESTEATLGASTCCEGALACALLL